MSNRKIPPGIKVSCLLVCIVLPLAVSSRHGGSFFQSLGSGSDEYVMLAMACCFIFSMPIFSSLAGWCFNHDLIGRGIAGVVTCFFLMVFSNISSTLAVHNTTGKTISNQVNQSTEVSTYQNMIDSNLKKIESLQNQIDGRDPVRWASKRDGWSRDIEQLQEKNLAMMGQMGQLKKANNGSTIGQALSKLESIGITLFGISVLCAALLDIVPFTAGLMLGSEVKKWQSEQRTSGDAETEKKRSNVTPIRQAN